MNQCPTCHIQLVTRSNICPNCDNVIKKHVENYKPYGDIFGETKNSSSADLFNFVLDD